MPASWTPPPRHVARALTGAAFCAVLALAAAPVAAAPIYALPQENPLNAISRGEQAASTAVITRRNEPAAGPRRDVQPPFLAWPADGPLESLFGARWGRQHEGLDVDGETGDAVVAAERGVVVLAEPDGGYGLTVEIAHGGRFAGLLSRYSHLSAAVVEPGDRVARGDPLGRIGTSGYVTGSHLHFEVHDSDGPLDPLDLLVPRDD